MSVLSNSTLFLFKLDSELPFTTNIFCNIVFFLTVNGYKHHRINLQIIGLNLACTCICGMFPHRSVSQSQPYVPGGTSPEAEQIESTNLMTVY